MENKKQKTALVTGSAGFIGYHISRRLLNEGWRVAGLDCMSDYYDGSLKEERERMLMQNKSYYSVHQKVETKGVLMNLFKDENPDGEGPFGLTKSNPIPVHGIDNIPAYMDKLRYRYESKSRSDAYSFNPIDFVRTSDSDKSKIGSKKPNAPVFASSTSSPNIKGAIDVYNLYSISGEMLAKIYVNSYSLKTSNKVSDGFFHRDEIPAVRDTKVLTELLKK